MTRIVDPDSHQAFPRLVAHVILGPLTSNLDDTWLNCLFHHLSQPKSRIYVFLHTTSQLTQSAPHAIDGISRTHN